MPDSWRWISVCVPMSRVSGPGGLAPSFRIPMVSKTRPCHVAQRMGTTPNNGSVESPYPRRGMMRPLPPVPRDSLHSPQRIGFPPTVSPLSVSTVSSSLHARFSVVFVSSSARDGTVSPLPLVSLRRMVPVLSFPFPPGFDRVGLGPFPIDCWVERDVRTRDVVWTTSDRHGPVQRDVWNTTIQAKTTTAWRVG